MKTKNKYYTVGTILKSNIKIVERGKIDTLNTQNTAHFHCLLNVICLPVLESFFAFSILIWLSEKCDFIVLVGKINMFSEKL